MLSKYCFLVRETCSLINKHLLKLSADETAPSQSRTTSQWRLEYQFGCALKCRSSDVLPAGECDIVPGLVAVYQLVIQIIGQRIVMNL